MKNQIYIIHMLLLFHMFPLKFLIYKIVIFLKQSTLHCCEHKIRKLIKEGQHFPLFFLTSAISLEIFYFVFFPFSFLCTFNGNAQKSAQKFLLFESSYCGNSITFLEELLCGQSR